MSKLTLQDVTNITGAETSAINTINGNSALVETALENTLSRDGTSPNQMNADIDLNMNDLLNVGSIDVESITLGGVALAADSVQAVGPAGPTGATGPQGPAGSTSPVADTSTTGTVTLGTFAQAIAGSPTGAYAPTLDVIKAIIDMVCPVGTISAFAQSTAPTYWLALDGTTIGSATSAATGRANADTSVLFTLLWNQTTNAELSIQTSTGTPSTRGISAAADFAADKRLPLPDMRGQFLRGYAAAGSVDSGRILLSAQTDLVKAHTHTGTTSSNGNHSHSITLPWRHGANGVGNIGYWSDGDSGGGSITNGTTTAGAHTHTLTIDANTGTENRPVNISVLYAIRY